VVSKHKKLRRRKKLPRFEAGRLAQFTKPKIEEDRKKNEARKLG